MKPNYFIDGPPGEKLAIYDNQKLNVAQILFIHGNSLSASVFEKQLRDEKLNSYRLIAFDLPGHGNSDRAVDPEKIYTLTGLMETITWVVKKTGLNKPVAVGFSLGAHLIVSHPLANKLFGGAFLFGYPPVSTLQDFMVCGHGSPALPLMFKPDLNEVELSLINHEMQRKEKSPEFSLNAAFTGSDPASRASLYSSITTSNINDETKAIAEFHKEVAIIHFEEDQFVRYDYLQSKNLQNLWKSKIHQIPNAGHCGFMEQPGKFNELLVEYVELVSEM